MKQAQLEPIENPQDGEVDDFFPFLFKTIKERSLEVPAIIAQQYSKASHYFFFYNGLCTKDDIQRFLRAQPLKRLESISTAFDIEPIDLVSEKRKVEGAILSDQDKEIIIEAILSSVTT